jgi:hypothetical protein
MSSPSRPSGPILRVASQWNSAASSVHGARLDFP